TEERPRVERPDALLVPNEAARGALEPHGFGPRAERKEERAEGHPAVTPLDAAAEERNRDLALFHVALLRRENHRRGAERPTTVAQEERHAGACAGGRGAGEADGEDPTRRDLGDGGPGARRRGPLGRPARQGRRYVGPRTPIGVRGRGPRGRRRGRTLELEGQLHCENGRLGEAIAARP